MFSVKNCEWMVDSCVGLFLGLWVYSIVLPIFFLANTMLFLLYYVYVIQHEIMDGDTSRCYFIVEDCLTILGFFFHLKWGITPLRSVRILLEISGIVLNQ